MSKVVTVLHKQTIWDIAIREYGSIEGVKDIMDYNEGVDLKKSLVVGQLIKIVGEPINKAVVDYYKTNGLIPVSRSNNDLTENGFSSGFSKGFN